MTQCTTAILCPIYSHRKAYIHHILYICNMGKKLNIIRITRQQYLGIFISLGFILSLFLSACNEKKNKTYLLTLEEKINQPDSVLSALQQIDSTQLKKGDKALYTYLQYACLDKQKKLPENSQPLEQALSFFISQNDSDRLCNMYYLKGKINHKHFYLLKAQDDYETACQYITLHTDYKLRIDLKISMGKLYHFYRIYNQEETLLDEASQLAIQNQDSSLITKLYILKSNLLKEQKRYKEALAFLHKTQPYTKAVSAKQRAKLYNESSIIHLFLLQTDSAYYYMNLAAQTDSLNPRYRLQREGLKAYIQKKESAIDYFWKVIETMPLEKRILAYRYAANEMKQQGKLDESRKFLEEHVRLRDSTYFGRKEELLERIQNLREYKTQQEHIVQVEKDLADKVLLLHRVVAFFVIVILSVFLFYYRIKQNKNKLKIQLLRTEQERNQSDLKRKEAEIQYLKEKEEKEAIALARLNQRLEYFKQLNEITIPILMQNRNKSGALHLQENDWTIIRNNTNACFDHFTDRLKGLYPQLTEEEINFCCLVKMELPLSVLAEIYHIAKGSISRKKMRLKEKIGIENRSFDEFITSL